MRRRQGAPMPMLMPMLMSMLMLICAHARAPERMNCRWRRRSAAMHRRHQGPARGPQPQRHHRHWHPPTSQRQQSRAGGSSRRASRRWAIPVAPSISAKERQSALQGSARRSCYIIYSTQTTSAVHGCWVLDAVRWIRRDTFLTTSIGKVSQIPDSSFQTPGSRFQTPGSRFQIPDSGFQIPDPRF